MWFPETFSQFMWEALVPEVLQVAEPVDLVAGAMEQVVMEGVMVEEILPEAAAAGEVAVRYY
jgi:hypothetical protein